MGRFLPCSLSLLAGKALRSQGKTGWQGSISRPGLFCSVACRERAVWIGWVRPLPNG